MKVITSNKHNVKRMHMCV